MNKVIYETKYNYYKKTDTVDKNYKMNKYLNKLNINGGASKLVLLAPPRITIENLLTTKNLVGEGGFGAVYKATINGIECVVKKFNGQVEYEQEKSIYIQKLSSNVGNILIQDRDVNIIDERLIDKIKSVNIEKFNLLISIQIQNIQGLKGIEVDVIGIFTDGRRESIGTCKHGIIYIDTFKRMRLLFFDDIEKLLVYKNLGMDLKKALLTPTYTHRAMLCIDLIRQVNDLIEAGIYHNDLKLENIVIKEIGGEYFLTLIDYGISFTDGDISAILSSDTDKEKVDKLNELFSKLSLPWLSPEFVKLFELSDQVPIPSHESYKEYKEYLIKMCHWSIAGICLCILNWQDVQSDVYISTFTIKKHLVMRRILNPKYTLIYKTNMLEHFPEHSKIFKGIVENMLEFETSDKKELFEYLQILTSECEYKSDYGSYLEKRKDYEIANEF
jgi:serine/threonine protein kinase